MTAKEASQGRVIHRKVKSGCITCRARRVKCDETRPQCIRCLKYGTECGGYLPGRRRPPSSSYGSFAQQARALVPKNHGPMMLQPASTLFESELELHYFRLFSDRIAAEICPYFNPESWSRMILQACMHEASIRHAAVAIGALGKTYEMAHAGKCAVDGQTLLLEIERLPAPGTTRESRTRQGLGQSEDLASESYMHHRHALEQYDKAIKRMRNDISSGNQSMRTTLIICIIIICFEAIHGNHESAAGQLQSGLALIQDWVAKQNRSLQHHPQGFSSPAPEVIEDFLVQSFGRMEIQSMSVFDPRPVEVHSMLKQEGRETIQAMPTQFSSMEQARIYLDLITRRLMHFTSSVHVPRTSGGSLERPKTPPPASRRGQATAWNEVISPMPWCDGKIPLATTSSTLSSQPLITEQASLSTELKTWTSAFAPLLTLSLCTGGQDAISALTLSISSIASQISLHSAFFINESAYDQFLPEFRQIVDLTTTLLHLQCSPTPTSSPPPPNSNSSPTPQSPPPPTTTTSPAKHDPLIHFAFDIGIVPPLYLVVVKCRNRTLRRRALALMEDHPRREGVWDSVATVALGRWVIGLEEEGARRFSSKSASPGAQQEEEEGGGEGELPIPEEMRVRKAAMRFDLLERRANLGCLQMDVEKGMFVQKREVFRW
ncbi:uncharacterized protein LY89DRAFT_776347 [Mollisia scopiformis]|uniref:Zn(2)-C6 fungal-type domain-containing protein n=1 Tax=Mollisia scopiformis TaxID=149040 RepID=A0A194XVZ1_MOLSC|nr:uncharacterized protein LY89DRAFT_776347 [Mollisia scopiformis]KUJ24184.1 hypothetical protein LY89DRAFT_776347 [Mollisia scopiformis]